MRQATVIVAALLGLAAIAFAFVEKRTPGSPNRDLVRVGVLPDQDPAELRSSFEPLLEYLAQLTDRDFELLVPDDYQHLVTLFEDQEIDLGYFGGLTFVQAQQSSGAEPLVMREADTRFTTSFVARNEAPWNDCWQLACGGLEDATILFGSRLSTSGHLMPRFFLQEELGIVPEDFFGDVGYSGAHDRTAKAVQQGTADIGAVNSAIFIAMSTDRRIDPEELVLIWQTPPYANYVWAIQEDTDPNTVTAIRDAFLALNDSDENEKGILEGLRASIFVPASARDFEPLVSIAKDSGLLAKP